MESNLYIPNVSLSKFILDKCKTFGNQTAMVDSETDRKLSFDSYVSLVCRIANGLLKIGFQKGDTLILFMTSCLEYPCCILAVAAIGGTMQAANPNYTPSELKHAFDICRPSYVMTSPDLVNIVRTVNISDVKKIITFGNAQGCLNFDDLISSCSGNQPIPNCDLDPARDTAAQLFSSGTTGLPKSVQISHRNIVANIIQTLPLMNIENGDVFLCCLPFFHIYAIVVMLTSLASGAKVVIMPRFQQIEFLENITKYKATHLSLVPPIMLWLSNLPNVPYDKVKTVKGIFCGAAPLSREVEDKVREIFHLNYISQGYGMTECLITHISTEQHNRYGSVGKSVPMTECKIIKPETGEILKSNNKGEVCVRGPQVMLGYLSNPLATSSTIDAHGWLHTGDIGYIDEDGFLFIVDRIKELIKYKGFQVAPAELEEVLLEHPGVADVGVIGIPDRDAGEVPKAFVVKANDEKVTEGELKKFVKERLSTYKQLRGGIEFVAEIPKSPSGKILRRLLREKVKNKKLSQL